MSQKLQSDYLSDNFVYSKNKDEVYCSYCVLFLTEEKRKSLKSFVNVGYSGWHNFIEKENKHLGNTYHSDAVQETLGMKNKIENPLHTLPVQNDSVNSERCKKYLIVLHTIARVIHLLGKQGLALRGHREDILDISSNSGNPGNFLMLLQ